jgi:hypothetical protein
MFYVHSAEIENASRFDDFRAVCVEKEGGVI